uniref:Uncharacterized protein n=1 Tax=Mus musculus TaxID=10090 RepID=Q9CXM1_MOUSE|nr:unnamed protein product [Mus musculus]
MLTCGGRDGEAPRRLQGTTWVGGSTAQTFLTSCSGRHRADDAGSRDLSDQTHRSASPPPWGFLKALLLTGGGDTGDGRRLISGHRGQSKKAQRLRTLTALHTMHPESLCWARLQNRFR